jgi:hypothetical protein
MDEFKINTELMTMKSVPDYTQKEAKGEVSQFATLWYQC